MLKFAGLLLIGSVYLIIHEIVRRRFHLSNENSRKAFHTVHGVIAGFAPFLIGYNWLILLELLLLADLILVRQLKWFRWLYQVGRVSWGDFFGIGGVIAIALLHPNKWIFLAAMLHLGIADALAALIGKRYGKSTTYTVFGQKKSLVGSMAFYVTSLVITTVMLHFTHFGQAAVPLLLLLPPLVTLSENVSVFGSDNLVIPVVVAVLLIL
jgi:phytol kinase